MKYPLTKLPLPSAFTYESPDKARAKVVRVGRASMLEFEVRPGDKLVAKGARNEIKLFPGHGIGVEAHYAIDVVIPRLDESKLRDDVIVFQCHDAPPAGVPWSKYESRPPLWAFAYVGGGGLVAVAGARKTERRIGECVIEVGKIVRLEVRALWTRDADVGRVEMYATHHGWPRTWLGTYLGPTMWNNTPGYVKFGPYAGKAKVGAPVRILYRSLEVSP